MTESRSVLGGIFFDIMKNRCIFLAVLILFVSCASRSQFSDEGRESLYPASAYLPESFAWQEVTDQAGEAVPGLWRFDFENPDIPLIYHAAKIELQGFILDTSEWERTSDFAAREKCLLAMNATPFSRTGLAGIHKAGNEVLSSPVARYAALGLNCGVDGSLTNARVFESQVDETLRDFDFALGGFFVVLKDGQVRQDFLRRCDSRSGVGVSADGRTLYLLVVEGEKANQSVGLSYPECGELFLAMGCKDALEMDGGGSSELCINGRSVLSYRVRRVQGNSFGFKVK